MSQPLLKRGKENIQKNHENEIKFLTRWEECDIIGTFGRADENLIDWGIAKR